MTKEQYLVFKSDLKKSIELIKLDKLHRKAYWNDGFKTQEEQNAAIEQVQKKRQEIFLSKCKNIYADYPETHIAYYCAKHRLSPEEINEYVKNEVKKMKFYKKDWTYDNYVEYVINSVELMFERYEEIVCPD